MSLKCWKFIERLPTVINAGLMTRMVRVQGNMGESGIRVLILTWTSLHYTIFDL